MTHSDTQEVLASIAMEYPSELRPRMLSDVPRQSFQIDTLARQIPKGARVCDLGGGHSLFAPGCAALGMDVVLLDRLCDPDPKRRELLARVRAKVHARYGVEILERDVIEQGICFEPASVDAFTSFAAIEHFHHSPKALFAEVGKALKPGGVFFLGAPNSVNLRKRITVPLGYGKWSQMQDWYEQERFGGHVREPDVADLLYIARDMGLVDAKVYGKNWIGLVHTNRVIRIGTKLFGRLLESRPTLCSDIYVLARRPK
jgi:SAM-dependent methyltransferase